MKYKIDNARRFLDDWKFWIGVAYFGLAAVVVGLFVLYSKNNKEEAFRVANIRSNSTAQVATCFSKNKNGPVVVRLINSLILISTNSTITTRATLKRTPVSDKLYEIELRSLDRLREAKKGFIEFRKRVEKTIPKRSHCVYLAHMLKVPIPKN